MISEIYRFLPLLEKENRFRLHAGKELERVTGALERCLISFPEPAEGLQLFELMEWALSLPWLRFAERRTVPVCSGMGEDRLIYPAPGQLPGLLKRLDRRIQACQNPDEYNAAIHAGIVLIHPLRDGNGRLARSLLISRGRTKGLGPVLLDYDFAWRKRAFQKACRSWSEGNSAPMMQFHRESELYSADIWSTVQARLDLLSGYDLREVVQLLSRELRLQTRPMVAMTSASSMSKWLSNH